MLAARGWAIALLLAPLVGACATTPGNHSWVGTVMTVSPHVCVGRHAAMGDCFVVARPTLLSDVRVGDCVEVTFTPAKDAGPATLQSVRHVAAKDHRQDCPT